MTHTCSVCGHTGEWGRTWTWYGSWGQLEDGDPIVKACSEICRRAAKAKGLVPRNARLLDEVSQ